MAYDVMWASQLVYHIFGCIPICILRANPFSDKNEEQLLLIKKIILKRKYVIKRAWYVPSPAK